MRWIVLVALLVLAGCSDPRAERAALAGQFVGRSEADLVRESGVPTRTVEAGGRRYVVYEERRVKLVQGPYGPGSAPSPGWGRPYYGGMFPPAAMELMCETSFEVSEGRVVGFSLRGNAC